MDQKTPRAEGPSTGKPPRDPIASLRAGYMAAVAVIGTLGAVTTWAAVARVETAVQAEGTVVPVGMNRRAQHLEGGVVREMLAREGDVVSAGQPIVRIAPVQAEAELGERRARIGSLSSQIDRLEAEASGTDFDPGNPPSPARRGEAIAFLANQTSLAARRAALEEQARKAEADAASRRAQLGGLREQESAVARSLQMQRRAMAAGGGSQGRMVEVEAQLAAVRAQAAGLPSAIESDETSAREARLRGQSEAAAARAEAAHRLTQVRAERDALVEAVESARDRLERTDVRAPVDGTIQKLNVAAVGEVVPPNSTVAEIVPAFDGLVVEAKIRPEDVRGLRPGLRTLVRLSAYDVSRFGTMEGELVSLAPDVTEDERTGQTHYRVRIRTASSEIGGEPVRVGMQASISVITGERSVLNYLAAPITDWAGRALRDK